MSAFEANNPFDLLGQTPPPAPAVKLHGAAEPQLELGWGQFHQGVSRNFGELFRRAGSQKSVLVGSFFKGSWIEHRIPRRAIVAAALWHIAFIVMPFPQFSAPKRNHAFDNSQITWSGPVEDFPLIQIPAARVKSHLRGNLNHSAAPEGADAFHPRQRIFTDPVRPTHSRQTLINPAAPPEAPKLLAELPNMVQLAPSAAPARPRLEISQRTLQKLRPREKHMVVEKNTVAPDLQPDQQRAADLNLIPTNNGPERPKLQINAGVAPRTSQKNQDATNEPVPELAAQLTSPNGSGQALIALSATPGPAAPVAPPAGHLAARVAISPEGKKPGVPGGSPGAESNSAASGDANSGGAVASSVGISITGVAPETANTISGLGGARKLSMPSMRPNYSRVDAARVEDEPQVRTGPPNFAALAPGAKPEVIFALRRIYSLNVNMT